MKHGEEFIDSLADLRSQVLSESFPVLRGRYLPRRQRGEGLADLIDRQADALCGADHGDTAEHVGEEAALISRGSLAREESVVVIPANRRGGNVHAFGHLADGQSTDVPVVLFDGFMVGDRCLDFNLSGGSTV